MLNFIKIVLSFFLAQNKTPTISKFLYDNKEGVVDEVIAPDRRGRVYSNGIWWTARCAKNITLAPGEEVQIIGLENITVWVEPIASK